MEPKPVLEPQSFVIDTELSQIYYNDILKFIHQHYLLPHPDVFTAVRRTTTDNLHTLSFTVLDPRRNWTVDVDMKAGKPVQVEMTPNGQVPEAIMNEIREDLIINVQFFEDAIRKSTLYFTWVEGEKIIPEKAPSKRGKASERMFTSSMLLLYALLFAVNIVLFIAFGIYGLLAIIILQFAIVLSSDQIYLRLGNWRITQQNPNVHILEYHLPTDEHKQFQAKFDKQKIIQMKTEIYNKTLAIGKPPTCELGRQIFTKYGMQCTPERETEKVINVYNIVKTAIQKFKLPMPKIVISNTSLPNAAATGPSPKRAVVLITTGLLVQLEDDEILSVIGHELGHLKGRDPLILFGLTSGEFILRLTVLLPLFFFQPFLYLAVVMTLIYFIAKFFEARADLQSAITIGQPKVLAEALQKIGFRRLQYERMPANKISGWIRWDPHPPTYFRIDRLEKLSTPVEVKHPLIQSIKDVFSGFKSAL